MPFSPTDQNPLGPEGAGIYVLCSGICRDVLLGRLAAAGISGRQWGDASIEGPQLLYVRWGGFDERPLPMIDARTRFQTCRGCGNLVDVLQIPADWHLL